MAISISGTTLTFNDNTTQTTAPKAIGVSSHGGIYLGVFNAWDLISSTYNYQTTKQWKTTATSTSGTASTTDGLANTNAMNNTTHPAAYYCATSMDGVGGYTDWYLPSKDELNRLYSDRSLIGGYTSDVYWSSTEYNAASSWYRYFSDGTQGNLNKTNTDYVRPVRRLSL